MCIRRSSQRRLFLATALLLPAPLFGQTATWLAPVSGSWFDGANWSTGTYPGPTMTALIAARGTPYTVTADGMVNPARVDLTSPDATLDITGYTADTTLNLGAGTAILHGTGLRYTTVTGSVSLAIDSVNPRLTEITLATDLRGAGTFNNNQTEFYGTLALNNGTVHLSSTLRPFFYNGVNVTGTGTIVADSGSLAAYVDAKTTAYPRTLTLGPGITLKTAAGGGNLSLDGSGSNPTIYNNGTISAEAPGTSISIGGSVINGTTFLSVVNGGLLAASNLGTLSVALPAGGTPGNLSLATGGKIALKGLDYSFTQPFTVPATTTLQLDGGWKVAAPLAVDAGGTLTVAANPTSAGAITYAGGATIQLVNTLSAPALSLLNTTPATNISLAGQLDLAGAAFSFSSIPGRWSFPAPQNQQPGSPASVTAKATIQNGTLSSAPAGNDLLPGGGAVNLSAVSVNFPLSIDDGIVVSQSNTTFAQPVSLSGTGRLILSSFSNPGGITATGGTLELPSLPASPGSISMSGTSTLQLDFVTTLTQLTSLPYGSPATIAFGRRGQLDLQSATVDLSTLPFDLAVAGDTGPGSINNGTIVDPSHAHPIRAYIPIPGGTTYRSQFTNVSCSADVIIEPGATLVAFKSSFHSSRLSGGGTLEHGPATTPNNLTLDNVILDVDFRARSNSPVTVINGLTANRAFTIDTNSVVDLTTSSLRLNYTNPSPVDTIRGHLLAGRLTSSAADATHRPGYLDSGSSITVLLTLAGDANLNGKLDPDDYALLDRAFAKSLANAHWSDGDFNYDGAVTSTDYLLIDTAYASQFALTPAFLSTRQSQFGDAYVAALLTSIPEPSFVACLFVGFLAVRRRK